MSAAVRVSFELLGRRPLLMHYDNIDGADELKTWRQQPSNKNQSTPGDDRTPPWTWQSYCYHDGEHVCMPQENVMAALLAGGSRIILQKQRTFKQLSQSGLLCLQEFLRFECGLPDKKGVTFRQVKVEDIQAIAELTFAEQCAEVKKLGFSLFTKRANVNGKKHVRVRPRFEHWRITGELQVLSNDITMDRLQSIFDHAGEAGLGDWRPSSPKRPGPFGMFEAKLQKQ